MTRKLLLPTVFVVAAIALMLWLGAWQLRRAQWKERLIAEYSRAEKLPPVSWPTIPLRTDQLPLFRHATGACLKPVGKRVAAGENNAGEPGYVQIVDCSTGAEGPGMSVELGWSKNPNAKVNWSGGLVSGIIVPDRQSRMRLVAATAPPGLKASRPPEASSISPITPAIHRGYAATWFSLAGIALVIYALAVRTRLKDERTRK